MKIERLDERTVKILLSAQDVADYDLSYSQMDYNDKSTRQFIFDIIGKVNLKSDFNPASNKLYIEAFPYLDGGLVMYINIVEIINDSPLAQSKPQSFDTPLIFEADNLHSLQSLAKRLQQRYNHVIAKSSLYLIDGKYRLLIYTFCRMEKKIISLATEYALFLGRGSILGEFTKEQGKEIINENALETIIKYLC